ncbi:MAG: DUF5615 family PIN-like protein, partial [Vagococcus sp.]|nr:DUF5615 family PIN-like protein [Vagococcus sp.]
GLGKKGISDEEVLKLAIEHSACLCTTNGKDFVIQIPPERQLSITHHGLVWVKGPGAWSRKNSDEIINFIIKNIEIAYPIDNHIFEVNRETIVFNWNKIYPL